MKMGLARNSTRLLSLLVFALLGHVHSLSAGEIAAIDAFRIQNPFVAYRGLHASRAGEADSDFSPYFSCNGDGDVVKLYAFRVSFVLYQFLFQLHSSRRSFSLNLFCGATAPP